MYFEGIFTVIDHGSKIFSLYMHQSETLVKEGDSVKFDNVLLIDKGGKVDVGMPTVKGASVSTKIISHLKADKVLVFKKKRRKGYAKLNGHRQLLTKIEIQAINA